MAAVACLQDWSGMTIHTYSYSSFLDRIQILGKESSSNAVGSIAYRDGYFSIWNDPAKFNLFYHATLMLRRGDVQPAKKLVGAKFGEPLTKLTTKAFDSLVERHRIVTVLDDTDTTGIDEIVLDTDVIPRENPKRIVSDTGELWRDLSRSFGAVDSPRTKMLYGRLGRYTAEDTRDRSQLDLAIDLTDMTVDCHTDFAVVALSSLTDDPINQSPHMLLTTIGRARNTGAQFDGEKMLDIGHAPILSEVIEADIAIRTNQEHLWVWAVNAEGYYAGRLDTTYEDGWLKFHVGDHFPACHYLIVAE